MRKKILMGVGLLVLGICFSRISRSELYQYTDKEGVVHFTDRPEEVPEEYRGKLKPVQAEITGKQNKRMKFLAERKRRELGEKDFVIFDKQGNVVGLKLKNLFLRSLIKSQLWIWLALELALLILAIILLLTFWNWPTQRGRKISAFSIILSYLILASAIFFLCVLPSAHHFLNLSQVYLIEIKSNFRLDPPVLEKLENLNQQLEFYQKLVFKHSP